jgi:hypothetical protein
MARREGVDAFAGWNAEDYLRDYYSRIEAEEEHTLRFLVKHCARLKPASTLLEFGCGPTLHHVLPFSRRAGEIHVADLLPQNLDAIRHWQAQSPRAHDWRAFTHRILCLEGLQEPTPKDIRDREDATRVAIQRRIVSDASDPRQFEVFRRHYDCIVSCYCADSSTTDKRQWGSRMRNIVSLLASGGLLLVAALRQCQGYSVGRHWFPSAHLDECDLADVYRGAGLCDVDIEVVEVPGRSQLGFGSILLASARRRAACA